MSSMTFDRFSRRQPFAVALKLTTALVGVSFVPLVLPNAAGVFDDSAFAQAASGGNGGSGSNSQLNTPSGAGGTGFAGAPGGDGFLGGAAAGGQDSAGGGGGGGGYGAIVTGT